MKIYIELDDQLLRNAITSQVGIELAKISGEVIKAQAEKIIATKMDRFDPVRVAEREVDRLVKDAVSARVEALLGSTYERGAKVKMLLLEAAQRAIKGGL